MTAPTPRPASTVIVLRDRLEHGVPAGHEIFMVKRHEQSAFMAGAYVFPGGRVDDSDDAPDFYAICDGIDAAAAHFPDLEPRDAIRYHLAAIRELFEEAGVLLARDASGCFVSFADPEVKLKFDAYRTAVHQGMLPLPLILQSEGLRFALDALFPWGHWITPEIESRRFDARFFVTRIPEGQVPLHDETETIHSQWISPQEALEGYDRRELTLAPPTLRNLEELVRFRSVAEVLESTRTRRIIPIQPRFIQQDGQVVILLPGDPMYPVEPGREIEGDTRIVLEEGRWWSRSPMSVA
jgi:8-oxo-dGTP pyrophosphatase MutT (NUDIX family)